MKLSKCNRARFRVKIKSLAEEARIIRSEERRCVGQSRNSDRNTLRHHRITVVRNEQRSTLLAYAFARGVPYSAVESTSSKEIDMKAVRRILASLALMTVKDGELGHWAGASPMVSV